MAFDRKRLILTSVSVLLALGVVVALNYSPTHKSEQASLGNSTGIDYSTSTISSSSPSLDNSQTTTIGSTAGAATLGPGFLIVPSECNGNCTLNIPWPTYKTLGALKAATDSAIIANVRSASTVSIGGVPVTRYNVAVSQTIIGTQITPGTVIPVAQIGGTANGTTMRLTGYPTLTLGGTYVFFLNYAGTYLVSYYTLFPLTVGGAQGLFYVQNGKVFSLDNMYPQADAWLPVKAAGVPLAQFIQQVQ
jgi:hypothetical protein